MRPIVLALPLLLALAGCDAGHRDRPGGDNELAGPALRIVQPRPDQVLDPQGIMVKVDAAGLQGTRGQVVLVSMDDEVLFEVRSPDEAFEIPFRLAPGAHVLKAWARDAGGRACRGAHALAVRVFHVGQRSNRFARRGDDALVRPFDEVLDPVIAWAGPWSKVSGERLVAIDVLVRGVDLGDGRHRLRVTSGDQTVEVGGDATAELALPPGEHAVDVQLLEAVDAPDGGEPAWRPVSGALARLRRTVEVT